MSAGERHSQQETVLGLDLGGTKLAAALFQLKGAPALRQSTPLDGRQGPEVGQLILDEVRRLRQAAESTGQRVRAVGIAVPGIARPQSGRVWAPNIAGWDDYPLGDELRSALANDDAAVVVTSDREAAILGETWQGAAQGCRHAVFLAVGTGIGAGILVDGRVVAGADGVAGAVGWMALNRPFQPQYVNWGCFESHASGEGIRRSAQAALQTRPNYHGPLAARHDLSTRDVFEAYDAGDEIAREVLDAAIAYWGMACANFVSIFNPEMIIFGGGVFGPAARFLDRIAAEARKWAQPVSVKRVRFTVSALGSDAVLYGTARSAWLHANPGERPADASPSRPHN